MISREQSSRVTIPWWRRIERREMLVLVLVGVIGVYAVMVADIMPIMVTSWIHGLGISERMAGVVATVNFAGAASGQIGAFLLLRRLSVYRIATFGLAISTLGDGGCIFAHSVGILCVMRALGGFGHAFVAIPVLNWLARHRHADRGFGAYMVLQVAVVSPMLMAVPALQSVIGSPAPYILLLGMTVVSLIFLPLLKLNGGDAPLARVVAPVGRVGGAARHGTSNWTRGLAMAAPALFAVAAMGDWSYLQRYGVSVGLSEVGLAAALAAIMVTGIPAGLLVVWLGKRAGRTLPIVVGVVAMVAPVVLFTIGISSLTAFTIGAAVFNIAWCVCIPFFQSIQADLDPTGRLVAISNFPNTIGTAMGPAMFAFMLGRGGYESAFLVSIALFACSLLAVVAPSLAADKFSSRPIGDALPPVAS